MILKKWLPFSVLFLSSLFLSTSFGQDEEGGRGQEMPPGWKQIQMPFSYQNIQVPREVWQTVKDILRKDGAKEEILDNFAVLPVAVNVDLMTDNKIVLREGLNYRVSYIEGGGDLDLFNYVVGKGPFSIRIMPELENTGDLHLLYISESPGKEMQGKSWGNGCGQIYDLSKAKDQFILENGIQVTSARRHYLHLMAGIFVFFQLVEGKLFLGYIRVNDSRYPSFTCREIK